MSLWKATHGAHWSIWLALIAETSEYNGTRWIVKFGFFHPFSIINRHGNHLPSSAAGNETNWTCNHCTYINSGDTQACEICSLPR
jgi:hypothetical protein